jgi:uncharacterized YccA/Bax inhibitor family protein
MDVIIEGLFIGWLLSDFGAAFFTSAGDNFGHSIFTVILFKLGCVFIGGLLVERSHGPRAFRKR